MMAVYLSVEDLKTHLRPETLSIIIGADEGIAREAIAAAVAEARIYLGRYDLVALFGDEASGIPPSHNDAALKRAVKAISVWNLMQLRGPNINMGHARGGYEDALRMLRDIQKEAAAPGWPLRPVTEQPQQGSGRVDIISVPKRNNYL